MFGLLFLHLCSQVFHLGALLRDTVLGIRGFRHGTRAMLTLN
ncbi:hypothetical protein GLYMA_16G124650v4 [Glycine max]|nr:hypothetical protein GLYMA_16G124650v4 [Glycine max]